MRRSRSRARVWASLSALVSAHSQPRGKIKIHAQHGAHTPSRQTSSWRNARLTTDKRNGAREKQSGARNIPFLHELDHRGRCRRVHLLLPLRVPNMLRARLTGRRRRAQGAERRAKRGVRVAACRCRHSHSRAARTRVACRLFLLRHRMAGAGLALRVKRASVLRAGAHSRHAEWRARHQTRLQRLQWQQRGPPQQGEPRRRRKRRAKGAAPWRSPSSAASSGTCSRRLKLPSKSDASWSLPSSAFRGACAFLRVRPRSWSLLLTHVQSRAFRSARSTLYRRRLCRCHASQC